MTDLVERLRGGCVLYPKRWTGDTHDDMGGSVDDIATDALMLEAATALEAQKIRQWYNDALNEIDELLARARKAEARADELATALEAAREDAYRLDFVLARSAWIRSKKADSGAITYWLETQDEDENYVRLSGPDFHCSPRVAIDAARKEVGDG